MYIIELAIFVLLSLLRHNNVAGSESDEEDENQQTNEWTNERKTEGKVDG